jgi:hypothetical protein
MGIWESIECNRLVTTAMPVSITEDATHPDTFAVSQTQTRITFPAMQLRRRSRIGLAIISVGLLPLFVLVIWRTTHKTVPVSKPVSLTVGHLRQPFTVNLTGSYTIRIEADRKLSHETLQCLLGIHDSVPEGQCKNIRPALNISWALLEDGQIIKTGSSATTVGGAYGNDTVANQLAWFDGIRGHHYVLDMDVLEDGAALSVANPKLRIGVDESVYEGFIFIELLVFVWAIVGCIVGGAMLMRSV